MIGKACRMFMHKLNLIKFGRHFVRLICVKMSTLECRHQIEYVQNGVEMVCNSTLTDLIRYNLCNSCNNSITHMHTQTQHLYTANVQVIS